MLQAILIILGLSLDSVIVMMQKGAQMVKLSWDKLIEYSLLFALVTAGTLSFGYVGSFFFQNLIDSPKVEGFIAVLIVFFIGVFTITKSVMRKGFEEKIDRDFGFKALLKQALYTNIDTFFVGTALSFYGFSYIPTACVMLLISFIAVLSALLIGYNLGAGCQRIVGVAGGCLMVFFSIYLSVLLFFPR